VSGVRALAGCPVGVGSSFGLFDPFGNATRSWDFSAIGVLPDDENGVRVHTWSEDCARGWSARYGCSQRRVMHQHSKTPPSQARMAPRTLTPCPKFPGLRGSAETGPEMQQRAARRTAALPAVDIMQISSVSDDGALHRRGRRGQWPSARRWTARESRRPASLSRT